MSVDVAFPPRMLFDFDEHGFPIDQDESTLRSPVQITQAMRKTAVSQVLAHAFSEMSPKISLRINKDDHENEDEDLVDEDDVNHVLMDIVSQLPAKMQDDVALRLLKGLDWLDFRGSPLRLTIDSQAKLIKTVVSWTNQLMKTYNTTEHVEFERRAPLSLASLALIYTLSGKHQVGLSSRHGRMQQAGKVTSNQEKTPDQILLASLVTNNDLELWIDKTSIQHSLADCTLKWFCSEFQEATHTPIDASLLLRCFERYAQEGSDESSVYSSQQLSTLRLLVNLTHHWAKLSENDQSTKTTDHSLRLIDRLCKIAKETPRFSFVTSWIFRAINALWYRRPFPLNKTTTMIRTQVLSEARDSFVNAQKMLAAPSTPIHLRFICIWSLLVIGTLSFALPYESLDPWRVEYAKNFLPILPLILNCATPISYEPVDRQLNSAAIKVLVAIQAGCIDKDLLEQFFHTSTILLLCSLKYLSLLMPKFFLVSSTRSHLHTLLTNTRYEQLRSCVELNNECHFQALLSLLLPPSIQTQCHEAVEAIITDVKQVASRYMGATEEVWVVSEFWDLCPPLSTTPCEDTLSLLMFQLCRIGMKVEYSLDLAQWNHDEAPQRKNPIDIVRDALKLILHSNDDSKPTLHPRFDSILRHGFMAQLWYPDMKDLEQVSDFMLRWNLLAKLFIYNTPLKPDQSGNINVKWNGANLSCRIYNGWPGSREDKEPAATDNKLPIQPSQLLKTLRLHINKPPESYILLFHACGEQELEPGRMIPEERESQDFGGPTPRRYFHYQLPAAINWALREQGSGNDIKRVIPNPVVICFAIDLKNDALLNEDGCFSLATPTTNPTTSIDAWTAAIIASRTRNYDIFNGFLHELDECPAISGPIASSYPTNANAHPLLQVSYYNDISINFKSKPTKATFQYDLQASIHQPPTTLLDLVSRSEDVPLQLAAHSSALKAIKLSVIAAIQFPFKHDGTNRRLLHTVRVSAPPEASSSSPAS